MSELDLVRELRAESGLPGPERLASGRARLSAAIAEETERAAGSPQGAVSLRVRSVGGTPRKRLTIGVGLLATAAVVAVLAEPAKAPLSPPKTRDTAAVQLLDAASVTVAAKTSKEPGSLQWIYTRSVDREQEQPTQAYDGWITFDGSRTAYLQNDKLTVNRENTLPAGSNTSPLGRYDANTTPETAYNALASLPSDPKALLAEISRHVSSAPQTGIFVSASANESTKEFEYLAQLIWNAYAAAPGTALAAVFKTMAAMPGITVEQGVPDAVGRPSVAVSPDGGRTELLLDPATYQVVGLRTTSGGVNQGGAGPGTGAVLYSLALVQVTMVSGPGRK